MAKEVVLHVGFHKTGTTSFQECCAYNSTLLRSFGVHYPRFRLSMTERFDNHSIPIFSAFSEFPEKYHNNIRFGFNVQSANTKYRHQLDLALQRNEERVVISGEDIGSLNASELTNLRDFILARVDKLRVIALIRAPYSLFPSHLQQVVKGGRCIDDFVWRGLLSVKVRTLQSAFGEEIEFYPFNMARHHSLGVVGFLLRQVGVPEEVMSRINSVTHNESASNEAVRTISYINCRLPFWVDGKIGPMRRDGDTQHLVVVPGARFCLNSAELEKSRQYLESESVWLAERLGAHFSGTVEAGAMVPSDADLIGWGEETLTAFETAMRRSDPHIAEIALEFLGGVGARLSAQGAAKAEAVNAVVARMRARNRSGFWR